MSRIMRFPTLVSVLLAFGDPNRDDPAMLGGVEGHPGGDEINIIFGRGRHSHGE